MGKRQLKKPRHRWKDNIKIKPLENLFGDLDYFYLAQSRTFLANFARQNYSEMIVKSVNTQQIYLKNIRIRKSIDISM